jgi:hypothetical protein
LRKNSGGSSPFEGLRGGFEGSRKKYRKKGIEKGDPVKQIFSPHSPI